MKAEIKSFLTPDILDLKSFKPDNIENVGFFLQLIVGPKGDQGEESFDLMVCTPDWLKENHQKDEILVGRHYLIMFEYNYDNLMKKVNGLVNELAGETWEEIGEKLARIGHWEFEDYKS